MVEFEKPVNIPLLSEEEYQDGLAKSRAQFKDKVEKISLSFGLLLRLSVQFIVFCS